MTETTYAYAQGDPHRLRGIQQAEVVHKGPAPKRIVTAYGFWIFLLSDIVMFSCFFASYAVLLGQTAGGPSGAQLFDLRITAAETAFLLLSSFACGLASIAADVRSAARNIPNIDVLPVAGINVYDVMRRHKRVLTRAALDALEARFK